MTTSLAKFSENDFVYFRIGVCFCVALLHRITRSKSHRCRRTQLMFFRAFVLQMLAACVCLVWPLFAAACTAAVGLRISRTITSAFLALLSVHGTVDMLIIVCFVTPYRQFLVSSARKIRCRHSGTVGVNFANTPRRCSVWYTDVRHEVRRYSIWT